MKPIIPLAAFLFVLGSLAGTQAPEQVRRAYVDCSTLTVTPSPATVPHSGGVIDFTIANPDGCSWFATLSTEASWAQITGGPTSGTGSATLTVTFARNRSRNSRPIKLFVGGRETGAKWIAITQDGRGRWAF